MGEVMSKFSSRMRNVIVATAIAFMTVGSSRATIVQVNSTSSASELAFPASTVDLVNQSQATLSSTVHTGYTPFSAGGFSTDATKINDGTLGLTTAAFPATVPEPSTLAMLALGGLSLMAWVKRSRRA